MSRFDPFPTLETPRLRLRALTPEDLDVFAALQADPQVVRYFGRPPLSREDCRRRLEDIATGIREGTSIRWGLALRDSGELVGSTGFWRWNQGHRWAEVGYELAPSQWGKGLMPEALRATFRYGFEHMELHRVEAQLDPANKASVRVLEKLGFVQEALLRENWFHDGRFTNTPIYGLLRHEFEAAAGG